jgi:hypothetical protein
MVKTLPFRVNVPGDRMLHLTLPPDVPAGPSEIVVVIAPVEASAAVESLAGRWQKYFPPDFDFDSALGEIRHEHHP